VEEVRGVNVGGYLRGDLLLCSFEEDSLGREESLCLREVGPPKIRDIKKRRGGSAFIADGKGQEH
jgi:hypothetical protein